MAAVPLTDEQNIAAPMPRFSHAGVDMPVTLVRTRATRVRPFYIECQLPQTPGAEVSAEFDAFPEALAWIDYRRRENPRRILRLVASGRITAKMARDLTAKGVIFERS